MASKPTSLNIMMPVETVNFDVDAFDGLVSAHGVTLNHFTSMPCPIGATDVNDIESHSQHSNCSNGRIYELAGTCTSFFSGNQTASLLEDIGIMDGSTVQVTLPRFYDNTDQEVFVQTADRFYLKDFETLRVTSEKFEHSQAETDRLLFPATTVHVVMGSDGKKYSPNVDFVVQNGFIKWLGQNQPGYDPKLERGEICSVRYAYQPFFYVKTLLHEIRVTRVDDNENGGTKLVRMNYAVLLQREHVYDNERNDDTRPDSRDTKGPRRGGFGSR